MITNMPIQFSETQRRNGTLFFLTALHFPVMATICTQRTAMGLWSPGVGRTSSAWNIQCSIPSSAATQPDEWGELCTLHSTLTPGYIYWLRQFQEVKPEDRDDQTNPSNGTVYPSPQNSAASQGPERKVFSNLVMIWRVVSRLKSGTVN